MIRRADPSVVLALVVLLWGVGGCASMAPDPRDDASRILGASASRMTPAGATRILWADPEKPSLPDGAYREIRVRVQAEGRDWAQWAPSRRGDPLTPEEVAHALAHGFRPIDVHAQEVLLRRPGRALVAISTWEPPVVLANGIPWRESSAWSESVAHGVHLVPSPEPIMAPEPGRGELMVAGLLMLTFLHQRRLRRS